MARGPFFDLEEGFLWKQSLKSPSTVMVKITNTTTATLTSMKTTVEEESNGWGVAGKEVESSLGVWPPGELTGIFVSAGGVA